jgi:hypothetical protein
MLHACGAAGERQKRPTHKVVDPAEALLQLGGSAMNQRRRAGDTSVVWIRCEHACGGGKETDSRGCRPSGSASTTWRKRNESAKKGWRHVRRLDTLRACMWRWQKRPTHEVVDPAEALLQLGGSAMNQRRRAGDTSVAWIRCEQDTRMDLPVHRMRMYAQSIHAMHKSSTCFLHLRAFLFASFFRGVRGYLPAATAACHFEHQAFSRLAPLPQHPNQARG